MSGRFSRGLSTARGQNVNGMEKHQAVFPGGWRESEKNGKKEPQSFDQRGTVGILTARRKTRSGQKERRTSRLNDEFKANGGG